MKNRYLVPVLLAFSTLGLVGEAYAQAGPAQIQAAGVVLQIQAIVANPALSQAAKIAAVRVALARVPAAQRLAVAAQAYKNTNASGVVAAAAQQAGVNTEQMASIADSLPSTADVGPTPGPTATGPTPGGDVTGDGNADRDRPLQLNGTPPSAT